MPQSINPGFILHYDICALILISIILFSVCFRKMFRGPSNVGFNLLCIIVFIMTVSDLVSATYSYPDIAARVEPWFLYALNTPYFILRVLSMPAYLLYILTEVGAWSLFKKKPLHRQILLALPMTVTILMLLVNLFHPFMFQITAEEGYHRLPGLTAIYISSAFYMFLSIYYVIKYSKLLTGIQTASLLSILPLQFGAVIFQLFYSNILIEMFASSCSILLLSITVHRPELLVHWELGTLTKHACIQDLKSICYIKKPITVFCIYFNTYNDLLTFIPEDRLSKLLGAKLQEVEYLRTPAFRKARIYSLDDGEFVMVADQTSKEETSRYAEILKILLNNTVTWEGVEVRLTSRICYFDSPGDIQDYNSLVAFLQQYKGLIPDQEEPFDVAALTTSRNFLARTRIDAILSDAIVNHRFQMYYQPIWSVKDKKYHSAEALIRLFSDEYGFISPELFIPAAEQSGAIHQIGDFIMDDVCRFIASDEFKESGLEYIEINLAVAQCMQPNLPIKIRECLEKHGVSPRQINLEITERDTITEKRIFEANIQALSIMGISMSLDDYGTGYSNLQRIMSLPLSIVKIDRSIVLQRDKPIMQAIIKNNVDMLLGLNKQIVVEGIEDMETADYFGNLGCQYIQGYVYSKPLNEKDFIAFVKERNNA